MQTTSSGWAQAQASSYRLVNQGVQISWQETITSGTQFFTIGASTIGGTDIIKGGGSFVTFWDKYQYTDYSAYVLSWTVARAIGQYPYGTFMAQADVELDNTSNLFTPMHDATIGSGILPFRPMKVAVGFNGESLQQFVGFTGQPEPTLGDRKMTLHAFDVMNNLNSTTVLASGTTYSGIYVNAKADVIMQDLLVSAGFSANQFSLDTSVNPAISFMTTANRKLGDIFADICEAEQGMMFVSENGIIRFWNRQHLFTSSGIGLQANFTVQNLRDIEYQTAPLINDVQVTAYPRAVQTKQSVYSSTNSAIAVPAGGYVTVPINFTDTYGDTPLPSYTVPGYSSTAISDSYFTANTSSDLSGVDGSGYVTLTSNRFHGSSVEFTFHNTYSSAMYLTSIVVWGTPASVTSPVVVRYNDQTSINQYGTNPANSGKVLEINNKLIQDYSTAYALAYNLVNDYKQPYRRYKLQNFANPALQIGDYVSVYMTETGETMQMFVTGIKTKLGRDSNLEQELIVEYRAPANYMVIGTGTIGTGAIAP
jgi:hypothetical protein